MPGPPTSYFSESDIHFLVDTVDPSLSGKIDAIKNDPAIIEGMIDHEARRLFQRIMLIGEDTLTTTISPRLLFTVMLRVARMELESQSYTIERTIAQKIPVFDTAQVISFLDNKLVMKYLADMLSSFTRIESFTLPVRVRKGIRRRVRYNDMDIDSLMRFCQVVDEEHRFGFYKRIADLCLFILGMFPEYTTMDYRYPSGSETMPRLFGRLRRSMEDYEEEGKRFYKLACEHKDARLLDLSEVLWNLHEKFILAKKPLNYISAHFLQFKKEKLFPSSYSKQGN